MKALKRHKYGPGLFEIDQRLRETMKERRILIPHRTLPESLSEFEDT